MHPLHVALHANIVTEQRLADAAERRRVRALVGPRPDVRDRLGAVLVRVGTRLQHHRPAPAARRVVAR